MGRRGRRKSFIPKNSFVIFFMQIITSGLIADGTSDRALIPLLRLVMQTHLNLPFEDPQLIQFEENDLKSKVHNALSNYTLDILFIHRDAENESWQNRQQEISGAIPPNATGNIVSVIPIKMTEAWLLTDEKAIRSAVGNVTSTASLNIPKISKLESCSAKKVLFDALTFASEYGAQRRRKFRPEQFRHRVAELTSDLSLIRQIPSFKRMEDQLIPVLLALNKAVAG